MLGYTDSSFAYSPPCETNKVVGRSSDDEEDVGPRRQAAFEIRKRLSAEAQNITPSGGIHHLQEQRRVCFQTCTKMADDCIHGWLPAELGCVSVLVSQAQRIQTGYFGGIRALRRILGCTVVVKQFAVLLT